MLSLDRSGYVHIYPCSAVTYVLVRWRASSPSVRAVLRVLLSCLRREHFLSPPISSPCPCALICGQCVYMTLLSVSSRQPPGGLWLSPGALWEQDVTAEFVQMEL